MRTFHVKNFSKFQHYKDRAPPWIKLYNELLEDYDFAKLPDTMKSHLILIWLLASRMDNKLPYDAAWVAGKINAQSPVDLDGMMQSGFIVDWDEDEARGKREDWASRYIPDEIRAAVFARDDNKCKMCEATENLEIDHIIPVSRGGTGAIENLQVLCRSCNRKKRAQLGYAGAEQVATQMSSPVEPRERDRGREREEKESPPKPPRKKREGRVLNADEMKVFEEWYAIYPLHKARLSAERAFKGALARASPDELMTSAARYRSECAGKEPKFIAHPATWLNAGRWKDEEPSVRNGHNVSEPRTPREPPPAAPEGWLGPKEIVH